MKPTDEQIHLWGESATGTSWEHAAIRYLVDELKGFRTEKPKAAEKQPEDKKVEDKKAGDGLVK